MGKLRYIGSKVRLTKHIVAVLGKSASNQRFVDLFCGTGVVSHAAMDTGWGILANDHLLSAVINTSARLLTRSEVPFSNLGGYEAVIEHLNSTPATEGFFYREYSPSGANLLRQKRPYFSEANACKIDAIRCEISRLKNTASITPLEHALLLADLMESVNQVANIAGTYGCFLRELSRAALRQICLSPRVLRWDGTPWSITNRDVFEVPTTQEDVVYLDPPYTKRQYAAYYHVLETIAHEDEPTVDGITGLRPWEEKSSPFCYKRTAAESLDRLLEQTPARRVLISYSSDGHIEFQVLEAILGKYGRVQVHKFPGFGRYTPNEESRRRSAKVELVEYLFDLRKT